MSIPVPISYGFMTYNGNKYFNVKYTGNENYRSFKVNNPVTQNDYNTQINELKAKDTQLTNSITEINGDITNINTDISGLKIPATLESNSGYYCF